MNERFRLLTVTLHDIVAGCRRRGVPEPSRHNSLQLPSLTYVFLVIVQACDEFVRALGSRPRFHIKIILGGVGKRVRAAPIDIILDMRTVIAVVVMVQLALALNHTRTLVVLDSRGLLETHKRFFHKLEQFGEVTFAYSFDKEIRLKYYEEYIYDRIVLMCTSQKGRYAPLA